MRITVFEKDIVDALTPFLNGCSFKAKINANGNIGLIFGCYCLIHLQSGFKEILRLQLEKAIGETIWDFDFEPTFNGDPVVIDFTMQGMKRRIMEIEPCKHCGGLMMEKKK